MKVDELKIKKDLTLNEFDILIDAEQDVKVLKKLFYFKLRTLNYSVKEASMMSGIKQFNAYKLEDKWNEGGYNSLLHKKGAGRKTKLNEKQMEELSNHLSKKDDWTIKEVQDLIYDNWKISYSHAALKYLLNTHFDVKIIKQKDRNKNESNNKIRNDEEENIQINNNNQDKLNELIDVLKKEKTDVFVVKKLFYLILIELNISKENACSVLKISEYTGKNWEKQWATGGSEGLKRKKGSGRKCRLSDKQLTELHNTFKTKQSWLMADILSLVESNFGVKYSQSQMHRILKKN